MLNMIRFQYLSSINQPDREMSQKKQSSHVHLRNYDNLKSLENKERFHNIVLKPEGMDIFKRYYPLIDYIQQSKADNLYLENRGLLSSPKTTSRVNDQNQQEYQANNFASNNYLGLSNHAQTIKGGVQAAKEFGVNSAGSPLAFGATKYYMQLKEELAQFWKCNSLLYSAGWMAGFGGVKGLVRQYDHVVIDEFADNSLMEGALAATKSTHKFRHLDEKHMAQVLADIRSKDSQNAIMVITEALFPNDSSSPNLNNYQQIAKKYNAYIAISCYHDFGIFGENGRGIWEEQNLQDRSNVLLIGTGSKTISINFGFVGCTHPNVAQYLKYYSTAYMFTNAINPVQANSALSALRVIKSHEGKLLRTSLLQRSVYLRSALEKKGYKPLGRASGFVCVEVGNEVLSRMIVRMLMDNNILVNNVEYPLVPAGKAIVRFSLMPDHSAEQLNQLVEVFDIINKHSKVFVDKKMAQKSGLSAKL